MWANLHRMTYISLTSDLRFLSTKDHGVSVNSLTDMMGAVVMSSYALPGLHFKPTLADLQASSTVYVIYNLFHMICCET